MCIFVVVFSVVYCDYVATETDSCTSPDLQVLSDDQIKPHEQRALNYLVNEYLLQNNYRLTSITFADENENQVR